MSSAPRAVLNSEARLTLTLTSSIALPARASTPPPRTPPRPRRAQGFVHVFAKSFGDNSLMHKFQFASENGVLVGVGVARRVAHLAALGAPRRRGAAPRLRARARPCPVAQAAARLTHRSDCLVGRVGVSVGRPRVGALNTVDALGGRLVETIVRASDKGYWHKGQAGSHAAGVWWKEWVPLGGIFASGRRQFSTRTTCSRSSAAAPTVGSGTNASTCPSQGTRRGRDGRRSAGSRRRGPTVRMTRDGMIHLFVRGVDKSIWYKSQALVNETLQFGAWKLLGGNTRAFSC